MAWLLIFFSTYHPQPVDPPARQSTQTEPAATQKSPATNDWVKYLALAVSGLSLVISFRANQRSKKTSDRNDHIEADGLLDEAWDLLGGGEEGTELISVFNSSPTDQEKAKRKIKAALKIKPNYARAHKTYGCYYQAKKQFESALEQFNLAIRSDPSYAKSFNSRGILFRDLNRHESAMTDFNEAIRLDPNDAVAFYNRGNLFVELNDYESAMSDYNEAIRLDPTDAVAFNNRGTLHRKQKKFDAAMADLDNAKRLDPKLANTFGNIGLVEFDMGNYEKAIENFQKSAELDPGYQELSSHWITKAQDMLNKS